MDYILGGICLLIAVTVIGHGMWLGFQSVWTDVFGQSKAKSSQSPTLRCCPRCSVPLIAAECYVCHWPQPADKQVADSRQAINALSAQIERLGQLGALDSTASEQLKLALHEAGSRLYTRAVDAQLHEQAAHNPVVEPVEVVEAAIVEPDESVIANIAPDEEPLSEPTPQERIAKYSASRLQSLTANEPVQKATAVPRRSWTDLLAGFMEERNIRWGELVGGLLIVCCSIALVISFWAEIEARPWLKFSLFNGVTAAIFGLGFYSEHRWRLTTTSRGLLSVGCLLVPLNFLAIAALSSVPGSDGLLTIAGELLSAGLFGALVYFAARVLIGRDEHWLAAGLLVPSLALLLVRRFVQPGVDLATLVAMAAVPTVAYLGANLWHLRALARELLPDEQRINGLFRFLGLTTFAVVLPLALLLYKSGSPIHSLRQMPALAGLLGFVPLCVGLLIWRKISGRSHAGLRTAGTSVAVVGVIVSLSGLVIGWPEPSALLPAAIVEFCILTFVAWRFALPAAHVLAAACLALAYLIVGHLASGEISWKGMSSQAMAAKLISGESGVLLAPLVIGYLGTAVFAIRRSLASRFAFSIATVGLTAVSVAMLAWFGLGNQGVPLGTGWVLLLYAACALGVAMRVRFASPAWGGIALLVVGVVQTALFRFAPTIDLAHPEAASLLLAATFCAGVAFITLLRGVLVPNSPLQRIAWQATVAVSGFAVLVLAVLIPETTVPWQAVNWGWIALLWGVSALALGWAPLGMLFQVALALAVMLAAVTPLANRSWYLQSSLPWMDPWTLQAVGVAWVVMCLLWIIARLAMGRPDVEASSRLSLIRFRVLLNSPWILVDRALSAALVGLLLFLSITAALPGICAELVPAGSNAAIDATALLQLGLSHEHAGQWGSWVLLGSLLVLLVVTLRQHPWRAWGYAALLVIAGGCPLMAAQFEDQRAVASGWAWCSSAYLAIASAGIWCRVPLARLVRRNGWPTWEENTAVRREATLLALLLGLVAPVGLGVIVASRALTGTMYVAGSAWDAVYLIAAALFMTFGTVLWVREQSDGASVDLEGPRPDWPVASGALVFLFGAVPLIGLLFYRIAMALVANPIAGPSAQSIFAQIGWPATYAGPSLLVAVVLIGYAMRERSGAFALAASTGLCMAVTVYGVLANAPAIAEASVWIRLAQLDALAAASFTLGWIAIARWDARREGRYGLTTGGPWFGAQSMLAPALLTLALGSAWIDLVVQPVRFPAPVVPPEIADLLGVTAVLITAFAVWSATEATQRRVSELGMSALFAAVAIVAAGIAAHWDSGNWLAYHTMYVAHGLIALALVTVAWREVAPLKNVEDGPSAIAPAGAMWPLLQGTIFLGLAFRQVDYYVWWAICGFAATGMLLLPSLAGVFQRRRYLYLAIPLINLAGIATVGEWRWIPELNEFIYWNIILLALPVPLWLAIERRLICTRRFQPKLNCTPVHRVATRVSVIALSLIVGFCLWGDATGATGPLPLFGLNWIALGACTVAALACLYDEQANDSVSLLYDLGLLVCAIVVDGFNLTPSWLLWTGTILLAAYALATSYLGSRRRGLAVVAEKLGIPHGTGYEHAALWWLVPSNGALVAAVVVMTFVVLLTNERTDLRVLASQATLVQVMSVALLARGDRRGVLQLVALSLGAVGAVFFGWAWLDPASTFTLLNALVIVAAALAIVAVLYGLGLTKLLPDASPWLVTAQRLVPVLALGSGLAICATLTVEIYQFAGSGAVAIAWLAILVVAATLLGLAFALLAAAVLPGRDPLGLTEEGRTAYVYAAEILFTLLFVHVRVTCPWLFRGFFQQFWPLIVMAIAYLGIGAAELLRRREHYVLSKPLENTGTLLPVLPVVGYWAADSRVDYSLLLLIVGVMYAGLSIARRSFGFGVLAAVAANGGLWYLLNRQEGWGFLAHPQVWLIPPALCVLAAAYLNRKQLSDAQMTAIRYGTSMAIYVSSTADIFLNGVAENPWLPMVLAGLSLAGILAGIMLRVRAFLFLGTGFLSLALFTVIWYAAVDLEQTWIWWASGIVLGVLVFLLFALFERKQHELLEVVERLKQWEG